jgi:3'-phosphoadenosine 5'-phosphosulfate sulfotransferase (PAPS reductase)/FAD synthetase
MKYLKEFMIENPPDFRISAGCCVGAKKKTSEAILKKFSPDLEVLGIRKAEGGVRAVAYKSCFDDVFGGCDRFRPIFWFKKDDIKAYEETFDVTHSRCYTVYNLKRTGCACCPFGPNFEHELKMAETYEPNLYKAAMFVFGKSYEYTRRYREYSRVKEEFE